MFDKEFNEKYEKEARSLANRLIDDDKLLVELIRKREFGLEKYKDISFQSNFENAMKVDTVKHAEEEIVDLFNYLIHEHYKTGDINPFRQIKIEKLIKKTYKFYKKIKEL